MKSSKMIDKSIVEKKSSSFSLALKFYSSTDVSKLKMLYAICRILDDLVDEKQSKDPSMEVDKFIYSQEVTSFFDKNKIPKRYLFDLASGVKQDLRKNRYENFEELYDYCYKVAGTVGIMIMYILGVTDAVTLKASEQMGVAMQLTNILRDINEDYIKLGRIYLPQEELRRFKLSDLDISERRYSENLRRLIEFQVKRAEEYYKKSYPYIKGRNKFALNITWYIYSGILSKIKSNNFNPFLGRVRLSKFEKIIRILRLSLVNKTIV